MTYLERIVRSWFPDQRVRVETLVNRDTWRVSVDFTYRELEQHAQLDGDVARAVLTPFRIQRRRARRLHWGRRK